MTWDDPLTQELVKGVGRIVLAGLLGLLLAYLVEWLEAWIRRARSSRR